MKFAGMLVFFALIGAVLCITASEKEVDDRIFLGYTIPSGGIVESEVAMEGHHVVASSVFSPGMKHYGRVQFQEVAVVTLMVNSQRSYGIDIQYLGKEEFHLDCKANEFGILSFRCTAETCACQ